MAAAGVCATADLCARASLPLTPTALLQRSPLPRSVAGHQQGAQDFVVSAFAEVYGSHGALLGRPPLSRALVPSGTQGRCWQGPLIWSAWRPGFFVPLGVCSSECLHVQVLLYARDTVSCSRRCTESRLARSALQELA